MIRTDNGPQFISNIFARVCQTCEVKHERIPPKTSNMNTYIESFHRLLEYECLERYMFQTYAEAYQEVATYIEFYNNRRIHSSILDLSPSEFYRLPQTEPLQIKIVKV